MMRAIVKLSSLDNEFALAHVEIPEISANEMLVKVMAIGVGIQDTYFFPQDITYPFVIGIEAAGKVIEVGEDVVNYRVDDRIAFISYNQPKGGTYAQYAAVSDKSTIILIPKEMDYPIAAAILMSADAAIKALNGLDLKTNDMLFVAGASGAIGTYLIQIAKERGLRVSASASLNNQQYMTDLGAEKTVDYRDDDWKDQIIEWSEGKVDGAIAIQPNTTKDCMQVVKDGATVVTISGDMVNSTDSVTVKHLSHAFNTKKDLNKLYKQVSIGEIKVEVDDNYVLKDSLEALKKVSKRHARGKTVIKVN